MATKKKIPTNTSPRLPMVRIGSRVRCTDDGVEGRIVWANGVSVKIRWDDGEQITWRRDSLAERPVEVLAGDEDQTATPAATAPEAAESPAPEAPPAAQATPEPNPAVTPAGAATVAEAPPAAPESGPEPPATEAPAPAPAMPDTTPAAAEAIPATEPTPPMSQPTETPGAAKPKRRRKAPAEPKEKKPSALDAAARVLAEAGRPMSCQEMIDAMAAKRYWTSPGGKTPAATLYSAILKETQTKGTESRFTKTERGKFALAVRG